MQLLGSCGLSRTAIMRELYSFSVVVPSSMPMLPVSSTAVVTLVYTAISLHSQALAIAYSRR